MRAAIYRTLADGVPVFIAGIFPVFAVVAPKGTVLVLILAGVTGLGLAIRQRALRELFPPVLASLALLALVWMLFKSLTVFDGSLTILLWLRLAGLTLCGFGAFWLFRTLSLKTKQRVHNALITGIMISLLVLLLAVIAFYFGLPGLPDPDHPDPLVHFSSGQMIIAILSALVSGVLLVRCRPIGAICLFLATLLIFLPMSSIIAIVALIAAAFGFVFVRLLPRIGLIVMGAVLMISVLVAPLGLLFIPDNFAESPILKDTLRPFVSVKGLDRSVQHRLQIWQFVTDRAMERPYAGWGLDASRRLPGGKKLTSLGEARLPLHPHNGILQVWLELGVPGVILLSLFVGYVVIGLANGRAPPTAAAVRIGMTLPAMIVGCLAFGIWQNWWVSSLWMLAALASSFSAADFPVGGHSGENDRRQ
jgi:exopolysaccharide production protein ExoQ